MGITDKAKKSHKLLKILQYVDSNGIQMIKLDVIRKKLLLASLQLSDSISGSCLGILVISMMQWKYQGYG